MAEGRERRSAVGAGAALVVAGALALGGCGGGSAPPPETGEAAEPVAAPVAEAAPAYRDPPLLRGSLPPLRRPEGAADGPPAPSVLLRLRVGAEGRVDSVEVEASSGSPAFDSAAVAQAREIAYFPAVDRDGRSVPAWVSETLRFEPPAAGPDTFPDRYYRQQLRTEPTSADLEIPARQ